MAKSYLTPQVEKWPTVYATDDIIIKDIPWRLFFSGDNQKLPAEYFPGRPKFEVK